MRKIIPFVCALLLGALALPQLAFAADSTSVRAILITASNQKGGVDAKLTPYEADLRRNLPFDTFRFAGEGSASVAGNGRTTLGLGRGHRLELEKEQGGGGLRLKVQWMNGGNVVMTTTLALQPGVPAVLVRRSGDEGETPVVLVIAR